MVETQDLTSEWWSRLKDRIAVLKKDLIEWLKSKWIDPDSDFEEFVEWTWIPFSDVKQNVDVFRYWR